MLWLVKHVDGIVSTSNMMRRISEKYTDVPHEVVYPFCDVKRFTKIRPQHKSIDICAIGTGACKGVDILYKAFTQINKRLPESRLYLCGSLDLIKSLKRPKNCMTPGHVNPVPYLSRSGMFINAARLEPFGVNILEAMAAGLPTLATKNCGASEILKEVDPELITSTDPKEIALKAVQLQKDVKKKKQIGEKSRKIVRKYTEKKSAADFKRAFNRILNQIS